MQPLERLVDNLHFGFRPFRSKKLHHLGRDFLISERSINLLHVIHHLFFGQAYLLLGLAVGGGNYIAHLTLLQQFHSSLEGNEFTHLSHIDAVVVGIAHLR